MVGLPKPCVSRLKFVSPGYGLLGSWGWMLLGPPTAFNIAWSSDTTSLWMGGREGRAEGEMEMGDVERGKGKEREREREREGGQLGIVTADVTTWGSRPCVCKQTKLHLPKPLQAVRPAHWTQCPLATGVSSPPVNTDPY